MKYLSVLAFVFTIACGQNQQGSFKQDHTDTVTAGKDSVQRLRQQCYASTANHATGTSDTTQVKVCVETPATKDRPAIFNPSSDPRKVAFSKVTGKSGMSQEKIDLNAGVKFSDADSLTDLNKAAIVARIKEDCLANIQYFWMNKGDIDMNLSIEAAADPTKVDQNLSLDLKSSTTKNFELNIDQWSSGATFNTYTTANCDKQVNNASGTDGEKDDIRAKCVKLSNQNFCLSVNKMLGHWLGAEDPTDYNCYAPPPAKTDDQKAKDAADAKDEDAAQKADDGLTSFMAFQVNPPATAPATSVAATTPPANSIVTNGAASSTTGTTDNKSTDAKASDSAPPSTVQDSKLVTAAADVDVNIDDVLKHKNSQDPEQPVSVPDQSNDDSYKQSWTTYKISRANLKSIFGCDVKPRKTRAKTPRQGNVATPAQRQQTPANPAQNNTTNRT